LYCEQRTREQSKLNRSRRTRVKPAFRDIIFGRLNRGAFTSVRNSLSPSMLAPLIKTPNPSLTLNQDFSRHPAESHSCQQSIISLANSILILA
jgi:hypothetical protein